MADEQKCIWLNGVKIPIVSAVQWRRVTPFPNQFSTSAPGVEDYTPTRKQEFSKLKGGMGQEKWDPNSADRYWDADGVEASRDVQTLGSLVTTIEKADGTGFGAQPVKIIKFNGRIWAIGHNQISYWDGVEWQSKKTDLANPTDAIVFYGTSEA